MDNNMDNTVKKESLSDARTFLEQTQRSISAVRGVYRFGLVIAAIIAISSVGYSLWKVSSEKNLVYVVDNESARLAKLVDDNLLLDWEISEHLSSFHTYFYNLSPNPETIDERIDMALALADRSAQLLDNRRRETQFYTSLVTNTMVEEIFIDSTVVNTAVIPYRARTYGRLYLTRSTNVTRYDFVSSCQLIKTDRTRQNPHGLMIENFKEEKVELTAKSTR